MRGTATEEPKRAGTPWHLWVVGVVSLIWNCGGAFDYTMTHTHNAAYLASFTSEQLAWFDGFPIWAATGWALGVWGALAGSLLLLARSRWAVSAFALSLLGVVITTFYQFGVGAIPASLDTGFTEAFSAAIGIVAVLLLWYAVRMRARRVLL
jgi:hypothetical protein